MTTSPNTPPSDAAGSQDAAQQRRPMHHVGCALVLVFLALALGGVLTALPTAARIIYFSGMSPKERRQMHRFLNEPVEIPPSLLEASPHPPQVTAELERLMGLWNKRSRKVDEANGFGEFDRVLGRYRALSQDAWDTATAILKAGEPLTSQLSVVAHLPGYDLEAFSAYGLNLVEGYDPWVLVNCCAPLLQMKAYERAYAEKWPEAFSSTLTMLELTRHGPLTRLGLQSHASFIQEWALRCLANLSLECTSTQMLSSTLARLNELKPIFYVESFQRPELLDTICTLRDYRRYGYPVKLIQAKTPAQYGIELQEKTAPEFRRWMLSRMDTKDPRRPLLERIVGGDARTKPPSFKQSLERWFSSTVPEAFFKKQGSYAYETASELNTLRKVHRAQYDLARLLIAGRLAQLDGHSTSSSLEVLVPRYLPEVPLDPFSQGKPYLWDAYRGLFYSIGPDGVDSKGILLYFRGSAGTGDIEVDLIYRSPYVAKTR